MNEVKCDTTTTGVGSNELFGLVVARPDNEVEPTGSTAQVRARVKRRDIFRAHHIRMVKEHPGWKYCPICGKRLLASPNQTALEAVHKTEK